jgi:hypothetical protein
MQDTQRKKGICYLTTHFKRTEDGFDVNLAPTHESSCFVQVKWDYDITGSYNAWSPEYQAYRYRRMYTPVDSNDTYDYGQSVISTKNKVRGSGSSLSVRFTAEDNKDCRILGWAATVSVNPKV